MVCLKKNTSHHQLMTRRTELNLKHQLSKALANRKTYKYYMYKKSKPIFLVMTILCVEAKPRDKNFSHRHHQQSPPALKKTSKTRFGLGCDLGGRCPAKSLPKIFIKQQLIILLTTDSPHKQPVNII